MIKTNTVDTTSKGTSSLPPEAIAASDARAQADAVSRSDIVRRLVELGLKAKGEGAVKLILPLLASAFFLALPDGALAESDDKAYCIQLADLYRRYVHTSSGWGSDVESAYAFDACRNGDPRAIPVLEKRLRENGIAVPGREFKP